MSSTKPLLAYWDVRGKAQAIRMLLAYLDIEYEEKLYPLTKPPHEGEEWKKEKFSLGLSFPNLPYWVEGDFKLTESAAILKYIAREKDPSGTLLPTNSKLACKADLLENVISDLSYGIGMLCYQYSEDKREQVLKEQNEKLSQISDFIGTSQWTLGENLSYVDFLLHESLYWHISFDKTFLNDFPILEILMRRMESLPRISKYIRSPKYIKSPCITPKAKYPI